MHRFHHNQLAQENKKKIPWQFFISLGPVPFSHLKCCCFFSFPWTILANKSAFFPTVYLIVTLFFTFASVLHTTDQAIAIRATVWDSGTLNGQQTLPWWRMRIQRKHLRLFLLSLFLFKKVCTLMCHEYPFLIFLCLVRPGQHKQLRSLLYFPCISVQRFFKKRKCYYFF